MVLDKTEASRLLLLPQVMGENAYFQNKIYCYNFGNLLVSVTMADMAWNTESPVSMDDDILHYLLFVYIWTRRISAALAAACCEYSDRENQSADDSDTRSPWPRHVRRGRDTCHTCLPTLTPAPRLGVNTLLWVAGDPSTLFFVVCGYLKIRD